MVDQQRLHLWTHLPRVPNAAPPSQPPVTSEAEQEYLYCPASVPFRPEGRFLPSGAACAVGSRAGRSSQEEVVCWRSAAQLVSHKSVRPNHTTSTSLTRMQGLMLMYLDTSRDRHLPLFAPFGLSLRTCYNFVTSSILIRQRRERCICI